MSANAFCPRLPTYGFNFLPFLFSPDRLAFAWFPSDLRYPFLFKIHAKMMNAKEKYR
jgi:hypothetical protein